MAFRTKIVVIAVAFLLALGVAVSFVFSPGPPVSTNPAQNTIGAISPAQALDYIKKTPDLFLLDIRTVEEFEDWHFTGAYNIPLHELAERAGEIPAERPVLLYCRRGNRVQVAYPILVHRRPDIPEISYIDAVPLHEEHNRWKREKDGGGSAATP